MSWLGRLTPLLSAASAGAAASIVDRDLAEFLVVGKVGGVIERLGKRGSRAGQLRGGWRGHARSRCTGRRIRCDGAPAAGGKQNRSAQREGDQSGLHAGDVPPSIGARIASRTDPSPMLGSRRNRLV